MATAVTTAQSPARRLGGGAATGHPWPEAQGEGAQDHEDSRSRPVNPAGRGRGPRRPLSWTPPPLGPKPHMLPGPNSAPAPSQSPRGSAPSLRLGPPGASSWLPPSTLAHSGRPFSEHPGRPQNVRPESHRCWLGGSNSGPSTNPQLSCRVPPRPPHPSRTSTPPAGHCPARSPQSTDSAAFSLSFPPRPP